MSIVVNMACGLANRMFQYAFYLSLKESGHDVRVDYFTNNRMPHENVDWEKIFPAADFEQASPWEIIRAGGGSSILAKLRRKFFKWTTNVIEMPGAFSLYNPDGNIKDVYLLGVFQSKLPALSIENELRNRFKFADFTDQKNIELAKKIQSENSIAIHVRKNEEYCKIKWYQNTCHIEYYEQAVKYISDKIDNPKFYVFTDNPDWVRCNFKNFDYELVDHNPTSGWGSHFDMQLMSLCKHNIISNSTYSWWGAFLNVNEDKIVIIPNIWFNPDCVENHTSQPLTCKGWIPM